MMERDMWTRYVQESREKFRIDGEQRQRTQTVFVEASNGSGSRYTVVATVLPPTGAFALGGGHWLVTLMWPWQAAWMLQADGDLYSSYVSEHWCKPGDGRIRSPEDLTGVGMAIAAATGREYVDG